MPVSLASESRWLRLPKEDARGLGGPTKVSAGLGAKGLNFSTSALKT
jgi:hypothetical protein